MEVEYKQRGNDTAEEIARKLGNCRAILASEYRKRNAERSPLTEAYYEFSARVFERDLARRSQ